MVRRFLITIDTEGDNLWASTTKTVTTENARFLARFQQLCEAFGLKPTYLTNYEMASCPVFREFARDLLKRRTAEIGMHLHAWNSPPLVPLGQDDDRYHPFLIEYPEHVMRGKINFLTELLEDTFQAPITSHRAGRWAFDRTYAALLIERGYLVDCSVTPHVSWKEILSARNGAEGCDYTSFPEHAYFLDPSDIALPGASPLLEVPMTVLSLQSALPGSLCRTANAVPVTRRVLNRFFPRAAWLRPRRGNLRGLLRVLKEADGRHYPYVQFMLHSSEFMPGGSPTFRTADDIEALYRDVAQLFAVASEHWRGATLTDFYCEYRTLTGLQDAVASAARD